MHWHRLDYDELSEMDTQGNLVVEDDDGVYIVCAHVKDKSEVLYALFFMDDSTYGDRIMQEYPTKPYDPDAFDKAMRIAFHENRKN